MGAPRVTRSTFTSSHPVHSARYLRRRTMVRVAVWTPIILGELVWISALISSIAQTGGAQ